VRADRGEDRRKRLGGNGRDGEVNGCSKEGQEKARSCKVVAGWCIWAGGGLWC